MRRILLVVGALMLLAPVTAVPASATAPATATPSQIDYTLDLDSDSSGAKWEGRQTAQFRNTGDSTLDEVWIRLWGNGPRGCDEVAVALSDPKGGELAEPSVDCTAVSITLDQPLEPGERASVSFAVNIEVPDDIGRFGSAGKYRFVGNATPVLAVHDGRDWRLPPYTDFESFYSLTADFDVTLSHPKDIAVPSTGVSRVTGAERGRRVTTIEAANVRDFAWAAGPFKSVTETTSDGVALNTWYPDDVAESTAQDVTDWVARGMETFDSAYGHYPYTEMDTVIGEWEGFSGMEYPNFILTEPSPDPAIHEAGHQWFYGMVGNDQYQDPWVDESLTQYITETVLGRPEECTAKPEWASRGQRIDAGMDYYFPDHAGEYGAIYAQGPCMLHQVEDRIGSEMMTAALRVYFERHKGGVATSDDLRDVLSEVSGRNLDDLWEMWRNTGP